MAKLQLRSREKQQQQNMNSERKPFSTGKYRHSIEQVKRQVKRAPFDTKNHRERHFNKRQTTMELSRASFIHECESQAEAR